MMITVYVHGRPVKWPLSFVRYMLEQYRRSDIPYAIYLSSLEGGRHKIASETRTEHDDRLL